MSSIEYKDNSWNIPDDPEIGYITGDGIGTDVTPAAIKVINAAVEKAYTGSKKISWKEVIIGEIANKEKGNYLPEDELERIKQLRIILKGPLTTPVGTGIRSLNVALRQIFDLYSCIRPVRYIKGTPSPMKHPEKLDIVLFRENTEDVYAGLEWESGSKDAKDFISLIKEKNGKIREDSAIGIKPISPTGSKRLIRAAFDYALKKKRSSLTLVHKGNIMKFTEGAFKNWGYEMLKQESRDKVVFEDETKEEGKILVKDRIADSIFQQLLLRPDEYDVIATMNLNGDYLSDAAAAQVGGLGMAPGANIGDGIAIFEATHGSAPKYAGQDKVNPTSVLLSGVMMLEHLGWDEAATLIINAIEKTILNKTVTYDLERQMEGAKLLKCSEYAEEIIKNL